MTTDYAYALPLSTDEEWQERAKQHITARTWKRQLIERLKTEPEYPFNDPFAFDLKLRFIRRFI